MTATDNSKGGLVDNLIDAISDFVGALISISLIGGGLLLFAGEIRLAALKKSYQGSSKLSGFTQRMTKTKLQLK